MLFQALIRQWEQYAADVKKVKGESVSIPDKVLSSTELVLDEDGQLQELNRVYGENEVHVCMCHILVHAYSRAAYKALGAPPKLSNRYYVHTIASYSVFVRSSAINVGRVVCLIKLSLMYNYNIIIN